MLIGLISVVIKYCGATRIFVIAKLLKSCREYCAQYIYVVASCLYYKIARAAALITLDIVYFCNVKCTIYDGRSTYSNGHFEH